MRYADAISKQIVNIIYFIIAYFEYFNQSKYFCQDSSNSARTKRGTGSESDRKKLTGVEKKLQKKSLGGKPPTGSNLSEYWRQHESCNNSLIWILKGRTLLYSL